MARARNIKPGFFANENLAECEPLARLLFAGLWCLADREGRLEDRPKRIRAELLPYDSCDADELLNQLSKQGFITRYEVDSQKLIQVNGFTKHQMPHHKEVASTFPPIPGTPAVTRHAHDVPKEMRESVFSRDGHRCLKCGCVESLTIDHIVPLSKGGDNSENNLQTLCHRCNSAKGDASKSYRGDVVVEESRRSNYKDGSTLNQRKTNDGDSCPPDSLIPDSLIPEEEHVDADASTHSAPQQAAEQEPGSGQTAQLFQIDRIPYEKIRDLYNQILGGKLKRCMGVTEAHRKHIRAAYNLKLDGGFPVRDGGLSFWEGLFNDVLDCPFMLGNNNRGWRADFEFLTTASKIQRFMEGKYDAA